MVEERTPAHLIGNSGQELQSVADLLFATPSDRAIVLENETNELLVMSTDGRTLAAHSNTGQGGARLGNPIAMTWVNGSELAVLDAQGPQIARFLLTGRGLELEDVQDIHGVTAPSGICNLDGQTFTTGTSTPEESSPILHRLTDTGSVAGSFGDAFGGGDDFARMFYGTTTLLCAQRDGLMIVGSLFHPELRAFDASGQLRWKATIPEYRAVTYRETAPGEVEYVYPADDLWDSTVGLFQPQAGLAAVQAGRHKGRAGGSTVDAIRTTYIDVRTGAIVGHQEDLLHIIAAGSQTAFGIDDERHMWFIKQAIQDD